MAERRMFSKSIIDSDMFLDMPTSSRLLYFDLSMRADDDGFVNSPKKIIRMTGASQDDLKLLIAKNFIIPFESGVVVIKHWKIHNYIRNDRYKPTICQAEKAMLEETPSKEYVLDSGIPHDRQIDTQMDTQVRLGKDSIDKDNKYSVNFESFWKCYPRKKEKAKAYKCYQARLKDGYSEEELMTACKNYASECEEKHTEERYIKLGATFLGCNTPFTDYLKGEEENAEPENRRPASDYYRKLLGLCDS